MALFTKENAAAMAARAHEARRVALEEIERRLADTSVTAEQTPDYILERLARVRKQLDRIDRMILTEDEPQKLDRLISATSRLEEQERRLSGRFAPGTTKPSSKPAQARHATVQPIGPAPQPVVVPPTDPQQ